MSAWISAGLRARLYTRSSSSSPRKYSPYGLLPPIHSGVLGACTVPVRAPLAASTPFTYSRSMLPSYVSATCVQAFTGLAVVPLTHATAPPILPPPDGRSAPVLVLAFRKYAATSRCIILRQPACAAVGKITPDSALPAATI